MRIAIIEDDAQERQLIRGFVEQFCEEYSIRVTVDVYENAEKLLRINTAVYEILLLDIELGEINGIDAARKIRQTNQNVVIMFITNMAQFAIAGYEVEAVDYMLKPVSYDDFALKFQKAIRKAARSRDNALILQCSEGVRRIAVSSLSYIEVMAHYLIYHTADREYKLRGSMKECEEELRPYYFARVHKSYLVNLSFVDNIRSGEVILTDGCKIPVGRAYRESLMQHFMEYIQGERI